MKIPMTSARVVAWIVLAAPGIVLLGTPVSRDELGIDPLKELFHRSGEIAIWTLGTVLCLSPLRTLFPRNKIVAALNGYRRSIGVTAFTYALLHVSFYFGYEGGIQSYLAGISEPFFVAGTAGFLTLCLLAATSNDWSIGRLGYPLWKWIHRLIYLAALALFYHQATAGKGNWGLAPVLFIPLATLEALRIGKVVVIPAFSRFLASKNGWDGWREFILDYRVAESDTITSFYLKPKDGAPLQPFRPGQYLTVQVEIPGQHPAIRTYTISDAPSQSYLRLSIKREREPGRPPGIVSNWLHDHFEAGKALLAKAPAGQFCLPTFNPVASVGAGPGLAPIHSLLGGRTESRVFRQSMNNFPVATDLNYSVAVKFEICNHQAIEGVSFSLSVTPP
jgi:DMSO/TMAO reductase YedYZ heme-binding membrane subunit